MFAYVTDTIAYQEANYWIQAHATLLQIIPVSKRAVEDPNERKHTGYWDSNPAPRKNFFTLIL